MALILSSLIEYFVKPRFPTSYTLFEAIAIHKDLKMVGAKLNSGADVNEEIEWGITPLIVAIEHANVEIVQVLIAYGANLNQPNPYPSGLIPLSKAVQEGNVEIIKLLVENGARINDFDDAGNNQMETVLSIGDISVVKCLIFCQ